MEIQILISPRSECDAEQVPEAASLSGSLVAEGPQNRPYADRGDRKAETDTEAHVKVEIIGKNRVDRPHALVPAIQDPVAKQDRIGRDGDDHADQAADHRPEREHHSDEQEGQIQLNSRRHRRQHPVRIVRQFDPGYRDEADRFHEQQAGNGGQEHINGAERQADHPADGKNPPLPALLLVLGRFGKGHRPQGSHRCHGKRQLFDVRGDAIESVPQSETIDALDELGTEEQKDRYQPVPVKKVPLHQGFRIRQRGDPARNKLRQPEHAGGIGLHQVLIPQQPLKRRGHGGAGHVVEQKNFLLLQFGVGPLGHFREQDDGHPTGSRTDTGADHELQVHAAGHHQEADENGSDDGLPVKPFFKMVRGFEQIPIFLEFLIVVHG